MDVIVKVLLKYVSFNDEKIGSSLSFVQLSRVRA